MNNRTSPIKRLVVYATLACMVAEPAFAATTDISNVPLSSGTSPLPPNVMFILDDSGSMARDFLPDYVSSSGGGVSARATTRGLDGRLNCVSGDPCYYTGGANGFNGLYYDPNVNYKPGINYDGTTVQPATLSTTSLEPDAYLGGTNVNLTNNTVSQDRVFCNGANLICKRNGADHATGNLLGSGALDFDTKNDGTSFTMGAGQFPYRTHKSNSSSQSFGLPEMLPLATFTRSGTTVTATTPVAHGLAVNDRVVVYGTGISSIDRIVATVTAVGSTTTFTYTSPTGGPQPTTIAVTASRNNSTVTVNSNGHGLIDGELITVTGGGSNFNVTGAMVTVTSSNAFEYTMPGNNDVGNTAISYQRAVITGSFRKYTSASSSRSGTTVTVTSAAHGLAVNDVISIQTGAAAHSRVAVTVATVAAGSFTYTTTNTSTSGSLGATFWARIPPFGPFAGTWSRSGVNVTVTSNGHGLTTGDMISVDADNDNQDRSSMAVTVTNANIFTYNGTSSGSTSGNLTWATLNGLYNDPDSNVTRNPIAFRITPVEYCSDANLTTCALATTPGTAPAGFLIPAYVRFCKTLGDATAPGVVTGNSGSPATARCISKFIDTGTTYTYARFGIFTRDNIVSTTTSYTNRPARNDCTSPGAPTCSYTEEIQNYARWYTYYRTRLNTMKTAGGRAFQSFTHNPAASQPQFPKLRVGFITINPQRDGNQGTTTNVQSIRYLKINDFAGNNATSHAANWYTKFYAIGQGSGVTELVGMTPLREALSRVGWIFAGKMGTGLTSGLTQANDDPVQVSCQRNFAILTTDGYWNNNVGKKLNNTDMDNQDNDNSGAVLVTGGETYDQPASSRAQGTYDGNLLSGTVAGGSPGGSGTLADVALYYFKNDLRGGTTPHTGPALNGVNVDVSANNVPTKPGNKNFVTHQHMVTFAIGMVDGLMRYQPDYETATTGDFANIKNGASGVCLWTTGVCDWPSPRDDSAAALDDLWHAAVNGRGTYYSGRDTAALVAGLESTLNALNLQVAAAAASSTSSPNITQTDRQIFSTTYETDTWSGRIVAQNIDPNTGTVEPAILWQADTQYVAAPLTTPGRVDTASDTRTIKTFCTGAAPCTSAKLKDFTWANLNATEQAYFSNKCSSSPTNLRQCTQITGGPTQADVNDGSKMVGYLRGWTGLELNSDLSVGSFRDRKFIDPGTGVVSQTVLGDTINAKPAFVRNPILQYADTGYAAHKGTYANRSPRLYVGANDGYLHSFHGDTGAEVWAYLPRFLMSGLWVLADSDYKNRHTYFADGSPETADVYDTATSSWKTILVAGVNNGGRGYYALDVTDPDNPKGLWEFCTDSTICPVSNANLGSTYGNPVIGKRSSDGKWVVVVTSGVNNVGSGDGKGYFYVLDAITGAILNTVATNVGDTTTPAGLAKIAGFYDNAVTDATFRYVYGGDQLGNVWRLDFNAVGGATAPVLLHLATLKDSAGKLQPITTKPTLTTISGNKVLYVGTGRYLGNKDLSNPASQVPPDTTTAWQQTLYAFKDKSTDYGTDIRSGATLVTQTLSALTSTTRTTSTNPVSWASTGDDGWLMDFNPANASPGERVNIDPELILGTLVVTTNVPIAGTGGPSCTIGGDSWQYQLDFKSGSFLSTSTGQIAGQKTGSVVTVGMAVVQLPSGAIKSIVTGADTSKSTITINLGAGAGTVRRFSYRER